MINFVVVMSNLLLYVSNIEVKRGAERQAGSDAGENARKTW